MFNLKLKFKNKIVLLIIFFLSLFFLLFILLNIIFVTKAYKQEMLLQNKVTLESLHTLEKQTMEKL